MDDKLKETLIEILEYFKHGLDDIEAGSGEYQTMQNEINYALPLVKNLTLPVVVVPKGTLCSEMNCENEATHIAYTEHWYSCERHRT